MKINEGMIDRVLRVLIGLVLIYFGFFASWPTIFGIVGLIPLITGVVGFCPLYRVFNFSTSE